jgi:hypothetical protein
LGFSEGALSPQPPPDIPRGMEMAKKFGLKILPPGPKRIASISRMKKFDLV